MQWRGLASGLRRHKDEMLRGMITKPRAQVRHGQQEDGAPPMLKQLDALIRSQKARIREGRSLERQTKIPVGQVTRDVEALGKLLQIKATMMMDLGLTKRAPTRFQGTHLGVLGTVQGMGVDGRMRIRETISKVLELARAEAGNGTEGAPGDPQGGQAEPKGETPATDEGVGP